MKNKKLLLLLAAATSMFMTSFSKSKEYFDAFKFNDDGKLLGCYFSPDFNDPTKKDTLLGIFLYPSAAPYLLDLSKKGAGQSLEVLKKAKKERSLVCVYTKMDTLHNRFYISKVIAASNSK